MKKLVEICVYNRVEAEQKGLLKVYGNYPANSEFHIPAHVSGEVSWGTVQRIGGQKPRLAGYIMGHIFYPVFLDWDHLFFPSKKKHT